MLSCVLLSLRNQYLSADLLARPHAHSVTYSYYYYYYYYYHSHCTTSLH